MKILLKNAKSALFVALVCLSNSALSDGHKDSPSLKKLWQSKAEFKVPESVLYDAKRKVLYVSNVDGKDPWKKDGKGSIGKLGLDGKVIAAEWVSGLQGPKGMGLLGDHLFATDIDAVVTINIADGKVVDRVTVPDAGHINDLSVAENGTVYFTDSKKGDIYTLINGKLSKIRQDIKSLNGVLYSQGELIYLADGAMYIVSPHGVAVKTAMGFEGGADGVERIDKNSWLVSTWAGVVYHVTREGKVSLLLDGRPQEINAADLGYDPVNQVGYFPGFWKNNVSAYQLILN